MTARTTDRRRALSVAEVFGLPAMATMPETCAALAISKDLGYELHASGEFPIEVVRVGRALRCRRTDILRFLGLAEDDENTEAVGCDPTASSERNTTPTSK